jgi:hypothetical protein
LKPTPTSAIRDGQARKAPEGARRSSPQSIGNRARFYITKLKQRFFPYLVTSGLDPPPYNKLALPVTDASPRPIATSAQRWARRLERWKVLRASNQLKANAIEEAITEAMLDSGTTKTVVNSGQGMQLTRPSDKIVVVANGGELAASNTALLQTRALSKGAREAIVVPGMSQPALMSVATLANNGYTTVFLPGNNGVDVFRANDVVISSTVPPSLHGRRDGRGLWMVPVVDDNPISPGLDVAETAMGVYELPSTKEVVRFLHAALGNPTQATLLTAAQHGNLVTFPDLTPQNISRHFPESDETQKGHMKQTKQGVRSTKIVDEDAMLGFKQQPGVKHKDVYLIVFDATKKSMFTNQMGKFPITPARGNKYIMVAVELDGNYIDGEPLQSRSAKSLTTAYQAIFQRWKATGVICPNWHILDNEAPEEFKQAIRENKCRVELTPADQHR